jgi:hypothetical protein
MGAGGHRFYQQSIPFFSLSRPDGGQGSACQMRVTRRTWTAAKRATTPTTSTEPRPRPDLGQWNKKPRCARWRDVEDAGRRVVGFEFVQHLVPPQAVDLVG